MGDSGSQGNRERVFPRLYLYLPHIPDRLPFNLCWCSQGRKGPPTWATIDGGGGGGMYQDAPGLGLGPKN